MEEKNLRHIDGKKIRRQYFSAPLIILVYSMISTSYGILVLDLMTGKFVLSDWLSGVLISFEICLVFSIPFLLLSILNRTCFGKIICVFNPDGIHHKDGLTRWSDIIKVEYEIEFYSKFEPHYCHAILYTKTERIVLDQAPLLLLSQVKKYSPATIAKLSKNSKGTIVFFIALIIVCVPLIALFKSPANG